MVWRIDPEARTVRASELDNPELNALKSQDAQYLNELGDVVYEGSESPHYFVVEGVRRPLHGVSYIVGTTEEGDDSVAQVSLAWLQDHLDFGSASNGIYYGDSIVRGLQ